MFNKSFWAMKQDLAHGHGIGFSLFGGQGVTNNDKQAILDFNSALEKGVKPAKAWATTMSNASVSAQNLTRDTLRTKGSLKELANGLKVTSVQAKATELGLKALSIAGNMLLMYGISKLLTAFSDYRDKLREISSEMSEQAEESANHVQSLLDLKRQLEEGTTSTEDLTTAFREQLRIMGYTETEIDNLIKKYGGLATAINKATDEALKNAKTEAFSDKTASAQLLENAPMFHLFKDIQIDKLSTGYKELDKQIEEIFSDVATIVTEDGNGSTVWDAKDYSADGLLAYYNALKKVNELLQETASETGDSNLEDLGDIFNTTLYGEIAESMDILSEGAEAYQSAIDKLHSADAQLELSNYLKTNDIESKEAFDTYINGIKNSKEYSEAYKQVLLKVANDAFPQFSASAKDASDSASNFTNKIDVSSILSGIQSLSTGLDQLDKIYADVKDGEYFDFSSILNNEKFTEAFGGLGESYENFIKTITNSPDDINACQEAFNNLATSYIHNSKELANVTDKTKIATIKMLEQMGVANAEEIVLEKLNAQKAYTAKTSKDLVDATSEDIKNFLEESDVAQETKNSIVSYYLEKQLANGITLNTSDEVGNLQKLISALGGATDALGIYYKALNGTLNYTDISGMSGSDGKYIKQMAMNQAKAEIEKINASLSNYKVNYGGGSTTKGGSSKDTKETFDWIETAISRIQQKISNLGKTVSATWKSWTDRNSALKSQISAVTQEINLQGDAAKKYEALAKGVSLSETYKRLVRDGALDISTVTNDTDVENIKKYKEYYEAYLEALDAKQDAEDELASLKQTGSDNISTEYDDLISFIEHEKSMLDSTTDLLENKGYMASASIYDKLIQYEYDTISTLEEKYKKLNENLNNSGIQQGTEQWDDMKLKILEVEEAILESRNNLVDYNNTLQELDWEVFDKLQEKISSITEEADFLIELMSDEKMFDNGSVTEHGQATLGLHALNYKTYLQQAEEYGQKLEEIREDIANDPYNQTLIEQEEEWEKAMRDSILAAEDEKQSIKDLVSEGYDNLLSTMDEIIDKRKEMLNQIQDMYEYEKNIRDLTKEVTSLEKQEMAFRGDNSEEGKAKYQQIKVSLEEARENLEETEREKTISDIEKMLDTLRDETEEWTNSRLDNLNGIIEEVITQTETNTDSILKTLETETSNVNTTLTSEMEKVWGTNGTFTTSLNSVVDMFKQYFDSLQQESDKEANKNVVSTPSGGSSSGSTTTATPTPAPSTNTISNSSSSSSSGWGSWFVSKTYAKQNLNPETSIVDRLKSKNINADFSYRSQYYRSMGGSGVYTGSASQNRWMLSQMKSHGFAQGGTIGNLIKATGEDGFVLARKGEGILTPENMKMLENAMINMNPIVNSLAKLPSLPDVHSRYSGDTQVTFEGGIQMYGVNDPVEFEKQLLHHMKNSRPVRMVMKDTTIGEALGKNSMIRYTR